MDNEDSPKDFSAWENMGTKRDFANMSNQKVGGKKKKRKSSTHWEFPTKLKLKGF